MSEHVQKNTHGEDDKNDDEQQHQDIKSRIAAFEQTSSTGPGPVKSALKPAIGSTSTTGTSTTRTAIPHGNYDPLQASDSTPQPKEPMIIRPSERLRAPPAPSVASKPTSPGTTRVALPGLGGRLSASTSPDPPASTSTGISRPHSLTQSRPWPPTKQPSSPSDIRSAISTAMDEAPSPRSAATSAVSTPTSAAFTTSLGSTGAPAAAPSTSTALPPPQLPVRKNSNNSNASASTSFSSFTNVSSISSEPSSLSSRIPPPLLGGKPGPATPGSTSRVSAEPNVPKLPPRKQDSRSSSISTYSTSDAVPRPPQRISTSNTTTSPATTPLESPSNSIPPKSAKLLPDRPQRSSTLQSNSSAHSTGPSLSSLPPRPREQSTSSTRSMPPPPSRDMPPPASTTPALSSGRRNANGPRTLAHPTETPKQYEALWEKLVQSFGQQSPARLEGLVVRQIWRMSKLNEAVLGRIWNQCDTNRQGSLNKAGFCKGLAMIDSELRQRRRRQGRS